MGKRLVKNVMTGLAVLSALGVTATPVFAAIPPGTVVFGNATAFDLGYANNSANTAAITTAVIASNNKIWVEDFSNDVIDNNTGKTVDISVVPSPLTYTDANGKVTQITPVDQTGFTFTTVLYALTGNTLVNVTVTAANVTAVTVKGSPATYIASLGIWRASVPGTGTLIPVAASDISLKTGTTGTVNAIDTTKTVAIKGNFGDVYYKVFLLSGVTPTSVTVTDSTGTTVLPYNATNGDYEKDIVYTATAPTSASVSVTTAAGTQTLPVTAS